MSPSGQVHGKHGYLVLSVAAIITTIDISSILRRIFNFFRPGEKFAFKSFWTEVILGKEEDSKGLHLGPEYAGLVSSDPEEIVLTPLSATPPKQVHYDLEDVEQDGTTNWANDVNRHRRNYSYTSEATLVRGRSFHSDDTLQEAPATASKGSLLRRVGNGVFHTVEYSLVIAGFMQVLTGIVIYTGGCRDNYINGCLAHLISAYFLTY